MIFIALIHTSRNRCTMDGPLATYYPVPAGGLGVLTFAGAPSMPLGRDQGSTWSDGRNLEAPDGGIQPLMLGFLQLWPNYAQLTSYFYLGIFHDIFHQLVVGVISFHLQLLVGPRWILNRIHFLSRWLHPTWGILGIGLHLDIPRT